MAWPIFAAAKLAGRAIPAGVYKVAGTLTVGIVIGIMFSLKFLVPPPSVQIEYITRVIEAQEPLQEIVVTNAIRQTEIQIVEKIIEKEVIKYVDRESDPVACNTPIGTVRLLNDARTGELRPDSLQGSAETSNDEGRSASTVTRSDLYEASAGVAIQYNQCKTQLNALIDWINIQQSSLSQ